MRTWIPFLVTCVCVLSTPLGGCSDEPGAAPGGGPTPGAPYAGSCHVEASAVCDEYAENKANATTMGACTAAGGVWSSGQCPLEDRTGVCTEPGTSTRKYTYTEAAATTLMGSCPKFMKFKPPEMTGGTGGAGGTGATGGTGMLPMPDGGMIRPDGGPDASVDGGP